MDSIDFINWWEATQESDLDKVKQTFTSLFTDAEFIPSIYHPVLYRFLKNQQIKHWNRENFTFSSEKIGGIENNLSVEIMSSTLLANLHLLLESYQQIIDLEERIILMNRFKGSEELKAKIFGINIYNDLLNGPFSNMLKLFIEFEGEIEGKNLFQKNLTPQIECLATPKRGYQPITDLADSNIRNAVSHGGVKVSGSKMIFAYRKKDQHLQHESTVYDFKDSIFQLFDGVSAIILAWFRYLCEKNIAYDEIYDNEYVHKDTALFFEKLSMSTLLTTCDKVYQLSINNDSGKSQRVNIEFIGVDLDINSRMFLGLYTAERVFHLRKLSTEDSIMISFKSPKIVTSFFVVECSLVNDLANGVITAENAIKKIWNSSTILMFPINDEDRNEFEDNFRYYADIETEDFYITEIEDVSHENTKRFKAIAYLKKAKRPSHVKKAVNEIIEQISVLENYGFTSHKAKHGSMKADILYLVLYKKRFDEEGIEHCFLTTIILLRKFNTT